MQLARTEAEENDHPNGSDRGASSTWAATVVIFNDPSLRSSASLLVIPGLVPGIQRSTRIGPSGKMDPGHEARHDREFDFPCQVFGLGRTAVSNHCPVLSFVEAR